MLESIVSVMLSDWFHCLDNPAFSKRTVKFKIFWVIKSL